MNHSGMKQYISLRAAPSARAASISAHGMAQTLMTQKNVKDEYFNCLVFEKSPVVLSMQHPNTAGRVTAIHEV